MTERCEKAEKEKEFLKSLNDTLLGNQKQFKQQQSFIEEKLRRKEAESKEKVAELEEQARWKTTKKL